MNVIVGMIYVCCVLIVGLNGDGSWEYVLVYRCVDMYIYIVNGVLVAEVFYCKEG